MALPIRLACVVTALLLAFDAAAQTTSQSMSAISASQPTLGEMLDAGAKRLTGDEFRKELVGPQVSGLSPTGYRLEIIYLDGGTLRGAGFASVMGGGAGGGQTFAVEGAWNIDDLDRVCVSMRLGNAVFPPRCQFWFRQGERYFLSDSDSDRQTRVLSRTIPR